ncbi:MAG: hypothetical protein ABUT39_14995 [Acidobacteriota bacterium]
MQLVQDPRDSQVILTAESSHADQQVQWRLDGDGKDFVILTSAQEGTVSRATLSLKRPVPQTWIRDSYVRLFAGLGIEGVTEATTTVNLIKFRRGGRVSPGASDICVRLEKGAPSRGWSFDPKSVEVHQYQDDSSVESLGRHSASDGVISRLQIHYLSIDDRGEGSYWLRQQVGFRGFTKAVARYDQGSWGHNASVGVASGILASVDNESVDLPGNSSGIRYAGYPSEVTLGITAKGGNGVAQGLSLEAGLTIGLKLSEQDWIADERWSQGFYVIESADDHVPGTEIKVDKLVKIGAGILLEQVDDNEWDLAAQAFISTFFPANKSPVEICFRPKF